MQTSFIPIDIIVNEFRRVVKDADFEKKDILAFANDALDRIITAEQFEHKIAIIPVKNCKAELPEGFKNVCQVAYRSVCKDVLTTKYEVVEYTKNILGSECDLTFNIACPKCKEYECDCNTALITVDADRLFSAKNPHHLHKHMDHFYDYGTMNTGERVSNYHPEFVLIRKTTSSFFNVPHHIAECVNFNLDCNIEYNIDLPNLIINQKDGEILISFYGIKLDKNGYRQIPDDPTVIRALTYCVVERYLHQKYLETFEKNREVAWQQHLRLSEVWVSRAASKLRMPEFDDLHSFVTGFIHRMVPKYNYWEDLMRRRGDNFKYPRETYNLKGYRKRS